jgi:P-type conjugative transfer protein TrbG
MNSRCLLWWLLLGCSCASSPAASSTTYVPARRIAPPAAPTPALPPSLAVSEQTLLPGVYTPVALRRVPAPAASTAAKPLRSDYDVIAEANRSARAAPSSSGYFNAVQTYTFVAGMVYQVYTATWRVTDVVLQPGEEYVPPLLAGDKMRWTMGVTESAANGVKLQHVVIKPSQPGLKTNLVINTNRRSYFIELHSFADDSSDNYMVGVQWRYPQDEMNELVTQARETRRLERNAVAINPASLNFHYALEILQGNPRWLPKQVFDDGKKTYITFPHDITSREVPVLYVARNGELQLCNYYPVGEFYVVDRTFDRAELRVGQTHQEIVRLERIR